MEVVERGRVVQNLKVKDRCPVAFLFCSSLSLSFVQHDAGMEECHNSHQLHEEENFHNSHESNPDCSFGVRRGSLDDGVYHGTVDPDMVEVKDALKFGIVLRQEFRNVDIRGNHGSPQVRRNRNSRTRMMVSFFQQKVV